ncbi:TPA: hypothetical protein ACPWIG_005224 [Pseudomonas aeruginosa]|uniref:hypothetical protein n=1 Tax=Pseudomonas aeruginosa TaxID=287 RepID=UPI0027324BCE|nr:hypothetical protein [Pseudomonas aeruginosa]MDP2556108.1 hypothetical protein [Pseudomonas aeruginosa]
MQTNIVFVVEKPAVLRALAPHLSRRWPGRIIQAVLTNYLGMYEFRYPRGLSFSAFPWIGEPEWKPRHPDQWAVWSVTSAAAAKTHTGLLETMRRADEVFCATDPDPSGAAAFHTLLSQALGDSVALAEHGALFLRSLDARHIEKALDEPSSTAAPWFVANRNAGLARRFFDFNFNVNALALFGRVLRQINPEHSGYVVSKYGVQFLYALADRPACSEFDALTSMTDWRGTGRHEPTPLGSPASRHEIIAGLKRAGLILGTERGGLAVSDLGHQFLGRLHPDCRDADLPARLRQWQRDWPRSRPAVERYLRTFFGKQKRFMAQV